MFRRESEGLGFHCIEGSWRGIPRVKVLLQTVLRVSL